jgi:hypothetical protein
MNVSTSHESPDESLIRRTLWIPFALLGIGLLSFFVACVTDILGIST